MERLWKHVPREVYRFANVNEAYEFLDNWLDKPEEWTEQLEDYEVLSGTVYFKEGQPFSVSFRYKLDLKEHVRLLVPTFLEASKNSEKSSRDLLPEEEIADKVRTFRSH